MPKKTPPPGPDGDQSDWVNYVMAAHGVASYDAWALSLDELREKYGPQPARPAPPAKKAAHAAQKTEG